MDIKKGDLVVMWDSYNVKKYNGIYTVEKLYTRYDGVKMLTIFANNKERSLYRNRFLNIAQRLNEIELAKLKTFINGDENETIE